jgi:hypothetical protein
MNSKAFREIPAPAKKADYVGQYLFLRVDSPADQREHIRKYTPARPYRKNYAAQGDVVRIVRRLNAKETQRGGWDVSSWGEIRVLALEFECSTCGTTHRDFIPESYIAEGKAVFVEKFVKGEAANHDEA